MNLLEYLLSKLIGVIMPLDLIIFIIIFFLLKKIENWGYRLLASFGIYIIVSEIISAIIRSNT